LILGITNRPDSHLAQNCDNLIVTECGIEVSVAATKTFVAQLVSLYLFAIYIAEKRQSIPIERANELKKALLLIPALQDKILSGEQQIREQSINMPMRMICFISRGYNYPIALEGALKLKSLVIYMLLDTLLEN